jgi:Trp operon repressor
MKGWRQFVKLCAGRSEEELEELFSLFLTLAEKEGLSDRCAALSELLRGEKSQRRRYCSGQ